MKLVCIIFVAIASIVSINAVPTSKKLADSISERTFTKAPVNVPIFNNGKVNPLYYAEIEISKQKFNVCLDTGSADLWLPHPSCHDDIACMKKKSFDFTKSPTFSTKNKHFLDAYGFGNVSGIVATDDISMGGLTAQGQIFGLALHETYNYGESKFDGIMGMSLNRIYEPGYIGNLPLFNSLVQQKVVDEPIFSFYFGGKGGTHGQLTLGGYDSSLFEGSLHFNTLLYPDSGRWFTRFDDVAVNGTPLNFRNKMALLDTGAPIIIASDIDAKTVHSSIDGALKISGRYFIPCNTTVAVSLQFAGIDYNITLAAEPIKIDGLCSSSIQSPGGQENKRGDVFGDPNIWIVGVPFLKTVYATFDIANLRVGFALPKTQAI
ncbi:1790_t:CDS:2 [Paraglomus occultum]|uniref:1790_t:CDS:1 n=1 Tax=Paraglomus occultum TaxID=144539 RepID=A0A9N9GJI3_9GLOM|nr:1790_t:CDS:2 [Paraglomus occultum]